MSTNRALSQLLGGIVAALVLVFLPLAEASTAQEPKGPYLKLLPPVPDAARDRWKSVDPGHISMQLDGFTSEHSWTAPPATMDGNGFTILVTASGQATAAGELTIGTAISVERGFSYDTAPERGPYFTIPPGQGGSKSLAIHITPSEYLTPGTEAVLWVGASYGPGVYYSYIVSETPLPPAPPLGPVKVPKPKGRLAASLDCPGSIVISALPSLNCHINITSFERNTATPVEVIFPDQLDTFGNHANGIQLDGDGQNDVFNWDQSYSWGFFVFACAGQQGTGANCYDNLTEPGMQSVRIIVKQGAQQVPLTLMINATGRDGDTGGTGGIVRFGNVEEVGHFINVEEDGSISSRPVRADWLSAQWEMVPVEGTDLVQLRNLWRPKIYLHVENGVLEAGPIGSDWLSARWQIMPVEDRPPFVLLRSAWLDNMFINAANGRLEIYAVGISTWESAWWWMLP